MSDKRTHQKQSEKFIDAARELEADESEETFDEKLRRIAKAPQHDKQD